MTKRRRLERAVLVAIAVWVVALVLECLWLRFAVSGETFDATDLLTGFFFLAPFALLLYAVAALVVCGLVAYIPAGERLVDGGGLRDALVAGALIAGLLVIVAMFPVPVRVGDDYAGICEEYTTVAPLVLARDVKRTNIHSTDWSNVYWASSKSC